MRWPVLQINNKNNFMFAICTKHVNERISCFETLKFLNCPLCKSTVYVLLYTMHFSGSIGVYFIYVSCHSDSVVPPNEGERFFKSVDIVQSRPWNSKFIHISNRMKAKQILVSLPDNCPIGIKQVVAIIWFDSCK